MSGFVDDGECLLPDDDMDLLRSTAFSVKHNLDGNCTVIKYALPYFQGLTALYGYFT